MADVANTLEAQGIASFARSWDELIASVTAQLEKAGASVMPAGAVTPASSLSDLSRCLGLVRIGRRLSAVPITRTFLA